MLESNTCVNDLEEGDVFRNAQFFPQTHQVAYSKYVQFITCPKKDIQASQYSKAEFFYHLNRLESSPNFYWHLGRSIRVLTDPSRIAGA